MSASRVLLLVLGATCGQLPLLPAAVAERAVARVDIASVYQRPVRRNYRDTSRYLVPGNAIWLEGRPGQIMRLSEWLDEIYAVGYGQATLAAIFASGNQLTVRHSDWALISSGRTIAPLSRGLTNGRGEDVTILFDTRIPEQGSHWVFDRHGDRLEFTAVQNLFHELAHARHQLNGTWRYWDSEGQAIAEENRFRADLGRRSGFPMVPVRAGIEGQQAWWPSRQAQDGGFRASPAQPRRQ